MNTNEDEDNMDNTSNFQSAEEESKITSNNSQKSTNDSTSEKDEIFYDLVNVDDNSGNLNDTREMDTDDAIVSTQLRATSKYPSGTRKVKSEIIKEGLSKSRIEEATIPIEVETNNNSDLIEVETATTDTNNPSNKVDTAITNSVVADNSGGMSLPPTNSTKTVVVGNDTNDIVNPDISDLIEDNTGTINTNTPPNKVDTATTESVVADNSGDMFSTPTNFAESTGVGNTTNDIENKPSNNFDLIEVNTATINTNTPSNKADTATTNSVVAANGGGLLLPTTNNAENANYGNDANNIEMDRNDTNTMETTPDPCTVETNTCFPNENSTDILPTTNEERSDNHSTESIPKTDGNPVIPKLPMILDEEINISTTGTNENESNTRSTNGKQLPVPPLVKH